MNISQIVADAAAKIIALGVGNNPLSLSDALAFKALEYGRNVSVRIQHKNCPEYIALSYIKAWEKGMYRLTGAHNAMEAEDVRRFKIVGRVIQTTPVRMRWPDLTQMGAGYYYWESNLLYCHGPYKSASERDAAFTFMID